MSHATDETTISATSEFSASSESFVNSRLIKSNTESSDKILKTTQTSQSNQGIPFSTVKEWHQKTLITDNESSSTTLRTKSENPVESTDSTLIDSWKSTYSSKNFDGDQFTKSMLQNNTSSTFNIEEISPPLKMIKEGFTSSQLISSLNTSPSIVVSSSSKDNTDTMSVTNSNLSTKNLLLETERFTVPVKPIEMSATQTKPSKSTMSPNKITFLDSTMPSVTMTKEDSTFRLPESVSSSTTMKMVTNSNPVSTFKIQAPPVETKETKQLTSILPSTGFIGTTEAKSTSKELSKNSLKESNLKKQFKTSSVFQKSNTPPVFIQGSQMKRTSPQSLSSSAIVSQSTKHPVFILKSSETYSIHSQAYTTNLHVGNTTEPIVR